MRLLLLTLALLTLVAPPTRAADAPPAPRPNILFLLSDDQRPDTIGALGNAAIRTPNLDKLCGRGVGFTRAHIMGGLQGAICVPSRAAILTGKTLFRCPEQPRDVPVWPAAFAAAGYRTFQTGKWHNGAPALNHAFQDSKNTFLGGMTDHLKAQVVDYRADGKYPKTAQRPVPKFDAEVFADTAVEFIRAQQGGQGVQPKPWFCWVSFTTPHDPRTPPPEYAAMYDPAKIPLPKNYMPRPALETGVLGIRDEKLLPVPRTQDAVRKEIADYYALITHLDAQVGRILAALAETGQEKNTIIVFAGDNGLAIGSHGLLGKQNVYEHSVGVPLVVAGPGVKGGLKSEALVYLLDLFPTVCDLAGVAVPGSVEGKSFAPALRGEKGGRESLFFAYTKLHRGVRDDRWKLIEWSVPGQPRVVQLFDLQADPDELNDLAKDPGHAGELKRMEAMLAAAKKDLGDPAAKE